MEIYKKKKVVILLLEKKSTIVSWLDIVIIERKNRQIRKITAKIGFSGFTNNPSEN